MITEVFCAVMDLHQRLGLPSIKDMGGSWERDVDGRWFIAINGPEARSLGPDEWKLDLPPWHMGVWFNGWLAGILTPAGGTLAAGALANEETLIEALRKAA